ncbi:MAG: flagellar motor protein MotA [Alphaproteobacteria bacterium]|nr:flagellar motor protein MotA [Alphaproteobacteria bacterium]
MSQTYDPYHLAGPTVYLIKKIIFLILVGLLGAALYQQIVDFFWSNPFINGLILFVLGIGIVLSFRQVIRLYSEVAWVNSLQDGNPAASDRQPSLLSPVAVILRDRQGERIITPASMRSILDSVGIRLDEASQTARYMTGLLVFLGLLGTFFGLLQTVSSVADVIQGLDISSSADAGNLFGSLKEGLEAPLAGMGTAFSSSLFGLSGSLVLGFLDLQAGQSQNAFYTDLEDWMSSMTELDHPMAVIQANQLGVSSDEMSAMFDRLGASVQSSSTSQNAVRAMAELAKGIDGLVKSRPCAPSRTIWASILRIRRKTTPNCAL